MAKIGVFIIVIALLGLVSTACAGITVGNIAISPSSDLVSGQTPVNVHFTVNLKPNGEYTFSEDNTLQLSTEVSNPTWRYILVQNDVEKPSSIAIGRNLNIKGDMLSYPSNNRISVKVSMEGLAPVVEDSTEIFVMAVREITNQGRVETEIVKKKMVKLPTSQPTQRPPHEITIIPTTIITTQQTPIITSNPTIDPQQQEIIDQLKRQNQLLEEQNRKLEEQSNLLQNLIDIWNNFLRALGVQK